MNRNRFNKLCVFPPKKFLLNINRLGIVGIISIFFLSIGNSQGEGFLKIGGDIGKPFHLVPLNVDSPRYRVALKEKLLTQDFFHVLMISMPSSRSESSLCVCEEVFEKPQENPLLDPIKEKVFFVSVMEANSNIWNSIEQEKNQLKSIEVKHYKMEISQRLAIGIQRAWGEMLLKTRYPSSSPLNGTGENTIEFGAFVHGLGFLSGGTHSPRWGVTKRMFELGSQLQAIVKTGADITPDGEDKLVSDLKELEESARKSKKMTPTQEKDLLDSIKALEKEPE